MGFQERAARSVDSGGQQHPQPLNLRAQRRVQPPPPPSCLACVAPNPELACGAEPRAGARLFGPQVVGDDAQSIYGFRAAVPTVFLQTKAAYEHLHLRQLR